MSDIKPLNWTTKTLALLSYLSLGFQVIYAGRSRYLWLPGMRTGRVWRHGRRIVRGHPRSPHFSMVIISVTVQLLDIGVLGYIGIVQHKEHFPGVLSIPPGTPCIYIFYTKKRFCFRDKMYVSPSEIKFIWFRVSTFTDSRHARGISSPNDYHPFPGLKQNIGGLRLKDDRELETAVTRWLITEGRHWYQQGKGRFVPR